jgi:hypothetical protein
MTNKPMLRALLVSSFLFVSADYAYVGVTLIVGGVVCTLGALLLAKTGD